MFSIIALAGLLMVIITTNLAIKGNVKHYWTAALGIYIFSFIAGYSIGQITVGLTFIPLALAIGYTFKLVKNRIKLFVCMATGLLIGIIMVAFVDDYWLFYPLTFFV